MSYVVTRTSILWDGDKHGYPWREVYSEALYHGQQVVVLSPECDDPCYVDLRLWENVEPGLKVIDCEPLDKDIAAHGPAVMDVIAKHCDGQFIVHLGSDELLEMGAFLKWLINRRQQLMTTPTIIKFWRWDFTYSSRLITELWAPHERMCIPQGVARKWVNRPVCLTPGAGGFLRVSSRVKTIECPHPIWHYNGLASEDQHALKHKLLCQSDKRQAARARIRYPERAKGDEFPIENCGWNHYIGKDRASSRARPVPRSHPKIMWPWLSKAEMHWRKYEEEPA